MKKRTIWTRMLCMTLALAMCLSLVPTAFAAETTEGQFLVEAETGSTEQVDVTITIDAVQQPNNTSPEASAAPVIVATETVAPRQAAVRNYMSQKFYEAYPYVYLVTDQGLFRYEIFSAHMAPVDSMTYAMAMKQENTRQEFLDYITGESVIETPVIPAVTDQIITLSTCSGRGYAKRWVIHARLEMLPVVS